MRKAVSAMEVRRLQINLQTTARRIQKLAQQNPASACRLERSLIPLDDAIVHLGAAAEELDNAGR